MFRCSRNFDFYSRDNNLQSLGRIEFAKLLPGNEPSSETQGQIVEARRKSKQAGKYGTK